MTRIEINEVYFVSKHVKNSNLRGVLCFNQRVVLCLQAGHEFQSMRCTSSPRCTSSLVGDGGSVKNVKEFKSTRCTSSPSKLVQSERAREREREREGGREGGRERRRGKHGKNSNQRGVFHVQTCQEFQSTRCTSSPRCISSPSKLAQSERERERGREGGREREKERQAWQEFNSTRCISCPNMSRIPIKEATRCTSPSMSRIPINEVYFVSKHVKKFNQRGVLRLQACQEFQSTRCTSSGVED